MGKDILERHLIFFFDDSGGTARDLTDDLVPGSITGIGLDHPEINMTGVGNDVNQYLTNTPNSEIGAQFFMNDTATTGAYTVLKGQSGSAGTLTIQFGTGAAPTTGDPEWEGEYILFGPSISVSDGAMVMDVTFRPQSGAAAPDWTTGV